MSEQPIYEVDYKQYNRMDFSGCCYRQSELKRTFHNCPKTQVSKKYSQILFMGIMGPDDAWHSLQSLEEERCHSQKIQLRQFLAGI